MYNYIKCITFCGVSTWSHIQVVVECPRGYLNKETADLCTAEETNDAFRSIPVTGRKTGLMYRNIYCAQCHGEEADFWMPNVKCPNNYNFSLNFSLTFNEILSHPKCVLVYQQPLNAPAFRPCYQHVIETCPEISKQCKDCRHKLVYSNEKIYKSPEIAACNNESTPGCIVPGKFNGCKISTTLNDTILDDTDALSHERNLSDCPRVTLNENEYTVLRDGRLQERVSQIVHEQHDIVMNGTDALVCISSRKSHPESLKRFLITRKDVSSIEGIISGIGTILSLVSLLMTIVVYATLRKLRNVPGCNVLSLSVALFIAEVLMLTAPETEGCYIVCKSISVAMHYFFLAAFIWMNVIAHDVWSTFTRVMNAANVSKKPSSRYVTYSMYAWLTPMLLTIPGLTLDLTFPDSQYAPGYGDGICWFSKKLGLLVFFATPLALIVTLNIIFFTMTVANICLVKRTSARRLGPDYRNQFSIYIKLFLVMGLTWVLGFLSAFVPHPVTTYLYITLNTLQGLFIGVSFVCTWKVLHLLQEFFGRGKYAISRSTTTQVPNYTVTYM
ncbi:G-protein coupled receptor Mth2-like [Haliotis rufescens]|uniref:G-protein coupled receptor Mth2-like n=1 Tax=Haliotis rufescens TaxID=6454 RepID=UPI00201F93E1|nr:G-protein coupled receptor Mth2-like [Haliotis rufescens]